MEEFQSIDTIGRKALIEKLQEELEWKNPDTIRGIGDDSAVLQEKDGSFTLLSSETYIEGIDFDLSYTPFHYLGYKLLSAVISDIYAMNGKPKAVTVNLSIPNKFSVQMIQDFYKGLNNAGTYHEVEIVGGDLNANYSHLVISIQAYGKVDEEHIVYRSGAQEDDAICVSGDLGGALAGLRILMREKGAWEQDQTTHFQPDLDNYEFVVRRQLVPDARKDVLDSFYDLDIKPTSMIDITKGLANELIELCEHSKVGATIFEAAIPVALETRSVANEMEEDVMKYAFFGGEDLELLFTLPKEDIEAFGKHFQDFAVIGKIAPEEAGIALQTAEGDVVTIDELTY